MLNIEFSQLWHDNKIVYIYFLLKQSLLLQGKVVYIYFLKTPPNELYSHRASYSSV